jgi:hypothetical protein
MAKQIQRRMRPERVMAVLVQQASAERYWLEQGGREPADAADQPRPLEFDASGFAVAQSRPSFAQRVGQLIRGS